MGNLLGTVLVNYDWLLTAWAKTQAFLFADVGNNTANIIKQVANNLQIAALAGMAASIMWGAGLFGMGGEEGARSAKKRWVRAAVGIVVCIAAWFIMNWLKGYASGNFSS